MPVSVVFYGLAESRSESVLSSTVSSFSSSFYVFALVDTILPAAVFLTEDSLQVVGNSPMEVTGFTATAPQRLSRLLSGSGKAMKVLGYWTVKPSQGSARELRTLALVPTLEGSTVDLLLRRDDMSFRVAPRSFLGNCRKAKSLYSEVDRGPQSAAEVGNPYMSRVSHGEPVELSQQSDGTAGRCRVIDTMGRIVRQDLPCRRKGTLAVRTWDLKDDHGRPLPSGIYFVAPDSRRDESDLHRVVIVR